MRIGLRALLLAPQLVCVAVSVATAGIGPDPIRLQEIVDRVFAGAIGDIAGDVNADGRASAADVSGSIFGLRNPTQPGPFGVGVRRITFTKKSAVQPGVDRVLRTDIWYPGPPGTGPINQLPGGAANVPFADGVSNLPLLMFSHGSCGFPGQSIALTPVFASYGFIVAAPPHPGNTINDLLTCGTAVAGAQSFVERPEDIMFVLDELLEMNEDLNSFFFGAIDPARIGMSGHSFGGLTTYRVTAMDSRIVAGLALAPAFGENIRAEVESIDVPMMVQGGVLDSVTEFDEDIAPSFAALAPPKYLVAIENTGHYAFNDVCLGGPECAASALSQDEAALYVRRFAVPFLLSRIAGNPELDAFLAPELVPPGVMLTAELE